MFFKEKKSGSSGLFSKKEESVISNIFSNKKTNLWSDTSNRIKQVVTPPKKHNIPEQIKDFVTTGVKDASDSASMLVKKATPKSKKSNVARKVKDFAKKAVDTSKKYDVTEKAKDFISTKSKPKTKKSNSWPKKAKLSDMAEKSSTALNQMLSTGVAKDVDRWFRDSFTQGTSSVYDKAMDSARQISGEFGGNHRLFDGGHSLTGAWEKVTNALPNDSLLDGVKGYVSALAKDGFTPAGLPVITFDRSNFNQLIENTGISRQWIEDAASVTGTELIGSSVAGVAAFLKWDKNDVREFTELASSMGVYSIASANPLLTITAISSLAYSWHINEKDNTVILKEMTKGAIPAVAFVTVAGTVPGPALLGLLAGAATAHVAKQAINKHIDDDKIVNLVNKKIEVFSSFKDASEFAKKNPLSLLQRDGQDGWRVIAKTQK